MRAAVNLSTLASAGAFLVAGTASAQTPGAAAPTTSAAPQLADAGPDSPTPASIADTLVGVSKEDYLAAQRLFAEGDYAGALARFETAYGASKDPRLLWNAAVCAKAMAHYVQAMTLMRRYLDSGSPLVTPEAARTANAFVIAAASLTAHLDLVSNESNASVYVDREFVGLTPLYPGFALDAGSHDVIVKKSGFAEFSTQITVIASKDTHVKATLAALVHDGRLAIHARPGDAIAVDGRVLAVQTWEGALPRGTHSVRVTAPAARPFQAEVAIRDGETQTLDVKLDPNPGGAGIPAWVWIAGGTVLAAGATTAGYFLLKSPDPGAIPMQGSVATVRLPLR